MLWSDRACMPRSATKVPGRPCRMAGGMAALDAGKARFCGSAPALGRGNGTRVFALFKARDLPAPRSARQRAGRRGHTVAHTLLRARTLRCVVELKGAAKLRPAPQLEIYVAVSWHRPLPTTRARLVCLQHSWCQCPRHIPARMQEQAYFSIGMHRDRATRQPSDASAKSQRLQAQARTRQLRPAAPRQATGVCNGATRL